MPNFDILFLLFVTVRAHSRRIKQMINAGVYSRQNVIFFKHTINPFPFTLSLSSLYQLFFLFFFFYFFFLLLFHIKLTISFIFQMYFILNLIILILNLKLFFPADWRHAQRRAALPIISLRSSRLPR